MSASIGIIGLGTCGLPTAKKLHQAGFEVLGFDLRPEVMAELESLGMQAAKSPRDAARRVDALIIMVLTTRQVLDVMHGPDGVLAGAQSNALIIGMSTISRSCVEELAKACADKGLRYLDCPFTGGPARVENGSITMIAAGVPETLQACRPYLEPLGSIVTAGDKPGQGQAIKHCNQLLVATVHMAAMELMALAKETGLDPKLVCDVVGSGIAGNNYFDICTRSVLEDQPSPASVDLFYKDINLVVDSAREHNMPLLISHAVAHYFNMAMAQGNSGQDAAVLMKVLERMYKKDAHTDPQ